MTDGGHWWESFHDGLWQVVQRALPPRTRAARRTQAGPGKGTA